MPTSTAQHLKALRELMVKHDLFAYVVPSGDAHQSEYIAECDARRAFISGFTGSSGTAVITTDKAALWTDGRYFLQASQQMDENWTLMKDHVPGTPTIVEWLIEVAASLPADSPRKIGIDPTLISEKKWCEWCDQLEVENNITPTSVNENLIDAIWTNRPSLPVGKVIVLPVEMTGKIATEKLADLRAEILKQSLEGIVLSALDQIAWLLNIRGSDIPYNPVTISYCLITLDEAFLFVNHEKVDEEARTYLNSIGVQLKSYDAIIPSLRNCVKKLGLDQDGDSHAIFEAAREGQGEVSLFKNPIPLAKALKNTVEQNGFRQSHMRDGVALVKFFAWLEDELVNKKNTTLNEVSAATKLEEFRSQQEHFMGLSFSTISGSGPNGAIIHYKPEASTAASLAVNLLYLCDSGGQYKDGTTDVTRTVHFGEPTDHQRKCFTRVLQGHIALARAIFPQGTFGHTLDVLARIPLWSQGLNYRHGTGHGVGHFLNVHEGPHGIGTRQTTTPLHPAMTVTNEPGYYEDGEFGIRIENVMLIKEMETPHRFGDVSYLGFETITMAPIQTKLVDKSLLTSFEIEWLDSYHQEVYEKLAPRLKDDPLTLDYLHRNTRPLGGNS